MNTAIRNIRSFAELLAPFMKTQVSLTVRAGNVIQQYIALIARLISGDNASNRARMR